MANAAFLPHDLTLPGVFADHPVQAANGSLWTLKFEVACYVAAAAMLFLAGVRRRLVLAAWLGSFLINIWLDSGGGQQGLYFYLGTLAYLYQFFGAGVVMYVFADRVVIRRKLGWAAAMITVAAIFTPVFNQVAATFGAYALLVFGYEAPAWFRRATARGDISYGTYLYAFPMQQLVLPLSAGSVALNIALALPLTLLAGGASWKMVEKPALSMKRRRNPSEIANHMRV